MHTKTCTVAIIGGVTGALFAIVIGTTSFLAPSTVRSADTPRTRLLEQYIAAQMKLAQVELKQIQQANSRVPNTFPKTFEERLRNHVMIKEEQLKFIQNEGRDDFIKVHKHLAETNVRMAVLELQSAQEANKQSPKAVPDLEVQRLESALDVARLHAALTDNPIDLQSSMTLLMYQVDELSEDVLNLEMKVAMLSLGWRKPSP